MAATPMASGQEEAYFSELLSYSLERLSKEPELLRADQDQLRQQVEDTAAGHYRSFIGATRTLGELRAQLQAAGGHLEALAHDLPKLQASADQFRQDAAAVNQRRADNRQLYSHHASLLELLELPQLMDTCIRNGSFDEALDLRAFSSKLAVVHGDLPVVQRLVGEVAAVSASLLEQLLQRLQAPIQLPECLRVIGYLRRLAAFPEAELRAHFLQRREAWVAELVSELDERSAYEFLKRLTDVYRLHLFDVVMQYRAIFADEPAAGQQDAHSRDGGILYAWAERRIAAYLAAVRAHLPRIAEGGSLASVLDHAMYCGMSLGRVGLDFRPLLAPLFEDAVLGMYTQALDVSTHSFCTLLEAHRWVGTHSVAARTRQPSDAAAAAAAEQASAEAASAGGGPPYSLLEHPPLAVYTNGLLAAFNELRHCAPLSLRDPAAEALQASLAGVCAALVHHGSARSLGASELPVFQAACTAFTATLLPYAAACFDRVYPGGAALLDTKAAAAPIAELSLQQDL